MQILLSLGRFLMLCFLLLCLGLSKMVKIRCCSRWRYLNCDASDFRGKLFQYLNLGVISVSSIQIDESQLFHLFNIHECVVLFTAKKPKTKSSSFYPSTFQNLHNMTFTERKKINSVLSPTGTSWNIVQLELVLLSLTSARKRSPLTFLKINK